MSPRIPTPPFAGLGLDRAEHLRDDPAALTAVATKARVISVDNRGLVRGQPGGAALHCASLTLSDALTLPASFLGLQKDCAWFAQRCDASTKASGDWLDLRTAAAQLPPFEAGLAAYARALLLWQNRHRYCAACGQPLRFARSGHVGHCDACDIDHFPRTDPAVIVRITHYDHILLARQAAWPERRYSLIAGFVEPGESLEDAVRREALEEVGISLADCHYLGSQPWPFPASLMLGFSASAPLREPKVGSELEHALWIRADALRAAYAEGRLLAPPRTSIARLMIDQWLAG